MNRVFADTYYWIALINRQDSGNKAVLELSRALASVLIFTTDEVLIEVLAFCSSDYRLRKEGALVVEDILYGRNIRVIPQSRDGFLDGFVLYKARPDKGYSVTDCISMQTMRREGLTDVLTKDRHFEQEGFRAVFR